MYEISTLVHSIIHTYTIFKLALSFQILKKYPNLTVLDIS